MTHLVPVLRPVLGSPFRRAELYRRAGEVPSFHIAPAAQRHARDLITGNLLGTYNSASPAYAVGPDGILALPAANAPVIEYDPVTLQCLGARIWGSVTNLLLRSEELGNAAWSRAALTVSSDVATSPKGTQDADKLVESATNAEHATWQSRSGQSETMTLSVFAKASERSRIKLGFSNFATAACGAIFNLSAGVVISTDAANADYTSPLALIFAYPAGWYRCIFTVTKGTANTTNNPFVDVVNNSNQTSYLGDGASGVFAWGAQLNTGSIAGPYIPTTTTTASSTADAISITGGDAARIINTAQGTLYVDFATSSAPPASTFPTAIQLQGANRQNEVQIYSTSNSVSYLIKTGNVAQAEAGLSATPQNGIKSAFRYAENNSRSYVNGQPLFLDTSCTMPTTDRIFIGSSNGSENFLNGYIREAAIIRSGRPDANLQALTS